MRPRATSHEVHASAAVPAERLFDVVVAQDVLPHVLHRFGPVPAVVGTADLTGPWDTPGSSRTVQLGDGSTARETVLAWTRPGHFRYRVEDLTGVFGRFVDHAIGEWWFRPAGEGRSSFTWRYTFHGRSALSVPVLGLVTRTVWAGYMRGCAERCVARAEDPAVAA